MKEIQPLSHLKTQSQFKQLMTCLNSLKCLKRNHNNKNVHLVGLPRSQIHFLKTLKCLSNRDSITLRQKIVTNNSKILRSSKIQLLKLNQGVIKTTLIAKNSIKKIYQSEQWSKSNLVLLSAKKLRYCKSTKITKEKPKVTPVKVSSERRQFKKRHLGKIQISYRQRLRIQTQSLEIL